MKNNILKTLLVTVASISLVVGCGETTSSIEETLSSDNTTSEVVQQELTILMKYETLQLGSEDKTLQVLISPESLSQEVTWNSSDANVATVDGGVLKVKNIGVTTITATSVANTSLTDSFVLRVTGTLITGVVKDVNGNLLEGVTVKYGEKTSLTDVNGKYSISLEDSKVIENLIIEKEGFRTQTIDMSELIQDGFVTRDVTLVPTEGKMNLSFAGIVKNITDGVLEGAKVKVDEQEVNTDNNGEFTFTNVSVGGTFSVNVEKDGYASFTKDYNVEDYISQIENGNTNIDLSVIDLYKYQAPINIYTSGNKHVSGQIYRTLNGVKFTYEANFDITPSHFFYELFLDFGASSPSDMSRSDARDMDFAITYEGIRSSQKYAGDTFGEGEPTFNSLTSDDKYIVEVEFPYTYLKMEQNEVFGFNVITHDDGVSDRSMALFGNMVEWYNYYTYPRVDLDNKIYQSNMNNNPFDLNNNEVVKSVELGTVGSNVDYQYKISLARDNEGLYVIAKKVNENVPYIQDGTYYHFFIDTAQEGFDRATDNQVVHFALESGRWMTKYDVEHQYSVFNNGKGMIDCNNMGIKYLAEKGQSILYIPYNILGNSFNRNSTLGIAANIEEGGGNWQKWQAPYISGYSAEPHVEEIKSFVRLTSELVVIPTV